MECMKRPSNVPGFEGGTRAQDESAGPPGERAHGVDQLEGFERLLAPAEFDAPQCAEAARIAEACLAGKDLRQARVEASQAFHVAFALGAPGCDESPGPGTLQARGEFRDTERGAPPIHVVDSNQREPGGIGIVPHRDRLLEQLDRASCFAPGVFDEAEGRDTGLRGAKAPSDPLGAVA